MQHLVSLVLVFLHCSQLGFGNSTSSTPETGTTESRQDSQEESRSSVPAHYTVDRETNFDNLQRMSNIYMDCLEETRFCFFFDHEKGCLHKEMCHFLVAIQAQDENFDQLHFDIINHSRDLPSVIKIVRPTGWAAIAFSEDRLMGKDLVFNCAYYGGASRIYATINVVKGNIYYDKAPYQNYLKNKAVYIGKRDSEIEARVLCSFDLSQTEDIVIDEFPFSKSKLKFNLKENQYNALLAIGQKMSKTWNLSYHTIKEASPKKFSREEYDRIVYGNRGNNCFKISMLLVTSSGILSLFV